jgi:hypothetical protein
MTTIPHRPGASEKTPQTGNRCGFALSSPRYLSQWFPNRAIADMQRRARVFYEERRFLTYAHRTRWRASSAGASGTLHDRAARAERAEACALLVQVLAERLDLRTHRIQDYRTGQGISVEELCRRSGMSRSRCKGALHDLTACGYLGGYQPRTREGDRYRGLPARRWFTRRMIALLSPAPVRTRLHQCAPVRTSAHQAAPESPPIDYAATWPSRDGPADE